ncbi:helix-turn-helix domain-containing protein [Paraburkholderia sp. MMS20-SJTR3]|uniref:Helix-turn-helix domain-containing protein n=1 Tax=Paraburkholderia sejongensis TaxID=2886946 RepID=A0ABS8K434_9BURK|nr:helix-turn-helix domain-containing protein [Paraburkholderia sp. MMS20-SJTR3]MCC8396906.1 helix-turn-helix domain-containing protein [Paraburkholderia sp. MMS20-SJTR3]
MARSNDDLPTIARRVAAGQKLLDGVPAAQIASEMGMSKATVERYRRLLEQGGLDALRSISVGGRHSALAAADLNWLAEALKGSPREHGFDADGWSNTRVRELIRRQFGISYSRVYVWQLATRLGVSHRLGRHGP